MLSLCRMDTGEALIILLASAQLRNDQAPTAEDPIRWSGTARKDWEGCDLGIAEALRFYLPVPKGMIAVTMDGWDEFAGSGFEHKTWVNDRLYYGWHGHEISLTSFEIAVSLGP